MSDDSGLFEETHETHHEEGDAADDVRPVRQTAGDEGKKKSGGFALKATAMAAVVVVVGGGMYAYTTMTQNGQGGRQAAALQKPVAVQHPIQTQPPQGPVAVAQPDPMILTPQPVMGSASMLNQAPVPQDAAVPKPSGPVAPSTLSSAVGPGDQRANIRPAPDAPAVASGPTPPPAAVMPAPASTAPAAPVNPAQLSDLDARTSRLHEEVKDLRGQVDRINAVLGRIESRLGLNEDGKPTRSVRHQPTAQHPSRQHKPAAAKKVAGPLDGDGQAKDSNAQEAKVKSSTTLVMKDAVNQKQAAAASKCEYLGGLDNRAWISCNGSIQSVQKGDRVSDGHGIVMNVDAQSGEVSTSSGEVIR